MKRLSKVFGVLGILLAFGMVSCSDGGGDSGDGGSGYSGGGAGVKQSLLKFNMGSMDALAIADKQADSLNLARNATTDSMLMKILEDGSLESFITVPSGMTLQQIQFIAQSPAEDAKEIYIVMSGQSYGWDETTKQSIRIGQLLCVLEDGTYYDILATDDDKTYKYLYNSSSDDPIVFDENGGMFYRVSENSGMSNTNVIYKFDAATGTSTQLTPKVENTYYEKMQISKDGKWIFVKANRWNSNSNTSYLQAIPVDNPQSPINLFFNSGNGSWISDWYYDDDAERVYFIKDSTVYYVPLQDDTFDVANRVMLFTDSNGNWFQWSTFFKNSSSQAYTWCGRRDYNGTKYYFRNPLTSEHEVQPAKIAEFLLARSADAMISNSGYDPDAYEIRFDTFADVPGFEALAEAAEGKTDAEAIAAIDEACLAGLMHQLWENGGRYTEDVYFGYAENNFFHDVLFKKEDGARIARSLFENNEDNTNYFKDRGLHEYELFTYDGYAPEWREEYLDENNKLVPSKVLEKMAEMCGKSAIDFSLEAFQSLAGYTALYTTAKNEEAVAFLNNKSRMQMLSNYLNGEWDSYNGAARFLLKTCFVRGSNYETPAYKWRTDNQNTIYWSSVNNLTPSYGKSLYGIYTYWNNNSGTLGLVRIVDEDGNADGTVIEQLKEFKIVECQPAEDGLYFKNALLNAQKEESGKHHIQYYDVVDDNCTDLFAQVTNPDSWDIISFSVGGNYLYYSAVSGFDIAAGRIDVTTGEVTALNSSQKLTKIITIK